MQKFLTGKGIAARRDYGANRNRVKVIADCPLPIANWDARQLAIGNGQSAIT
jgi:hypothetical protein